MSFETAAKFAAKGCLVKPHLLQFFQDPGIDFSFRLNFQTVQDRPYDGWFHSSSHPSMTEEQLYHYLTSPVVRDLTARADYVTRMSRLFGTTAHGIVRSALTQMRLLLPLPPGPCIACGLPRSSKTGKIICEEHGAIDTVMHSRGHLDGILDLKQDGIRGFDLKTIKMFGKYGLKEAPDMELEYFMVTWPKYYAQGQDYMRMTGLRQFIVLFMVLGNPWEFREYQFDFDPDYARGIEDRYQGALERAGMWPA